MRIRRSAMFTALLSALLWTSFAFGDKLELNSEGKKHFLAGVAYVDDPSGSKWEEALKEFRLAYAATPTSKLMNNIGLCALNLERDGEAIEAFKTYLAGGGESDLKPKQRKQIEKDIETLSAGLVKVSIQTQPLDVTLVDKRENAKGQMVINLYPVKAGAVSIGLHPGRHKITAEAPGFVSAEWVVDGEPASSHSHNFKLESEKKVEPEPVAAPPVAVESAAAPVSEGPKPNTRRTPTAVYIGLAATGVFAATATATGLIAMKKSKDLDKISEPAAAEDAKGPVKTWALVTDIAIGAAVVSAGATAYFYFTAPKAAPEKPVATQRIQFAPFVTTNLAGGAVFGSF